VNQYRQVLYLMQQQQSDRAIAKTGLMGRKKIAAFRCRASEEGWTSPGATLPDNATLHKIFQHPKQQTAGPSSSLELHRALITSWVEDGINGRVIHRVLSVPSAT